MFAPVTCIVLAAAVPVDNAFNVLFVLALVVVLRPRKRLPGHPLHLYLIAGGWFRPVHEAVRSTPKVFGPTSGYRLAAPAKVILGVARYGQRRQAAGQLLVSPPTTP